MVYKRVSKIIFAAILAVTVFSGCGNRQEEKIELLRQKAPDTFAYFFELDENGWNL